MSLAKQYDICGKLYEPLLREKYESGEIKY